MRKALSIIIIISLGTIMISCNGKKTDSKKKALATFEKMYPETTHVKWKSINDSTWKVNFALDNKKMMARFNDNGEWLISKTSVKAGDMPLFVIDKIDGFYKGYLITKSKFVESPDLKAYEIILDVNTKRIRVLISDNGTLLKAESFNQAEAE